LDARIGVDAAENKLHKAGFISFIQKLSFCVLQRPDACYQYLQPDWGKWEQGNKVNSFRCGICPADRNASFDLMTDGTIAARRNHDLVIGFVPGRDSTSFVHWSDPSALRFRDILSLAGTSAILDVCRLQMQAPMQSEMSNVRGVPNDHGPKKQCPTCNHANVSDAKFCGKCGTEFRACPKCKTVVPRGNHFCHECGEKLRECTTCGEELASDANFCGKCGTRNDRETRKTEDILLQPLIGTHTR
jgi:RNA polymerase subunit RPABC4/transcription elongation factor Spt4